MSKRDLWNDCYAGEHTRSLSPDDFRRVFCQRCRNAGCSNSAVGTSRWVNRMETQVDLLLNNPLFADPDDPRFEAVRGLDFADMVREALALEIASERGDWEIPSEADVARKAAEMAASLPAAFTGSEAEPGQEPEPVVLWEGEAKGAKGATYDIRLTDLGEGDPVWTCTCPSFHYRKAPPEGCKHIVEARELYLAEREVVEEDAAPPVPTREGETDPEAWGQMRERNLVPKAPNTRWPSEGLMVDGSPPPDEAPAADPWEAPATPKPRGRVVQVHGSVQMGGDKPEGGPK